MAITTYTFATTSPAGTVNAIRVSGTKSLSDLVTFLNSNPTYGSYSNNTFTFNATLLLDSTGPDGTCIFTASDCVLYFPSYFTLAVPNSAGQTATATNFTDVEIIYDGGAKSYYDALNYGVHTWTRVTYRNALTSGRTDFFTNNGESFTFNDVRFVSYGSDYLHLYSSSTQTLANVSARSFNSAVFELGSAPSSVQTAQNFTLSGFGTITFDNNGSSYTGDIDMRSLTWDATTWTINRGSGAGSPKFYFTNPNKPGGWTAYATQVNSSPGGSNSLYERFTHSVSVVDASANGVNGVSVALYYPAGSSFEYGSPTPLSTSGGSTGVPATIAQQYCNTYIAGTAYAGARTALAYKYGYFVTTGSRTFTSAISDTLLMVTDSNVTLSQAAVSALTSLATLDNLYDASESWHKSSLTNVQYPSIGSQPIIASGTALNLGAKNLIINSGTTTAGGAFAVNTGTNTITIYASSLAPGTKFKSFTTTGTITVGAGVTVTAAFSTTSTVSNSGTINAVYSSSAGTSGVLTLTGLLAGSSIYVQPNNSLLTQYLASSGTTATFYIPPNSGAAGSASYKVAKYGYSPVTSTFTPNGSISVAAPQSPDVGVTVAAGSVGTVAAYTTLSSPDQIYDYAAYWETQSSGIAYTRVTTKSGSQLSFGSAAVTLTTTNPGSPYVTNGSTTATIYSASSFGAGSTYNSFTTTSTVTLTGITYGTTMTCAYTSSAGTAGVVTISGLQANSVVVSDLGIATANSGTSVNIYIPPSTAGSVIRYSVTRYGYIPLYDNTLVGNPASLSPVSKQVSQIPDAGIVSSLATTSAQTTGGIATLDQLYEYWSFYLYGGTGTTTGASAYFTNVKAGNWSSSTAPISKVGTVISVVSGVTTLVFSTAAISGTTATSASSITIAGVASTLSAGTTFQTISAPGVTTFTTTGITLGAQYTIAAGTSGVLSFSGLQAGSTVYIYTTSGGTAQLSTPTVVSGTSMTFSIAPNTGANWTWKIVKYGYLPLYSSSSYVSNTVTSYAVTQLTDPGITQSTVATVAAYTVLGDADKLYDYIAYWETQAAGIVYTRPSTKNGKSIDFAAQNIVLSNTSTSPLVSYSATAPGTLTAYVGASLSVGTTNFTANTSSTPTITTTGTITFAGSTPSVTGSAILKSGTATGTSALISSYLAFVGLPTGSAVYVTNSSGGSGTQVDYQSGLNSGTYFKALPMAAQGSYSYKVTSYTFTSSGFVNFTTQGTVSPTISLSTDLGITQSSASTVAAYTSITNTDQLYDYLAYWETQQPSSNGGIGYNRLTTKAGKSINFGSYNLVLTSGTNSPPLSFNGTTTATVYVGTSLGVGTGTFTANSASSPTVYTTGTITFTGSAVTGSAILQSGTSPVITSGYLSLTLPSGATNTTSVYITNASGAAATGYNSVTGSVVTNPLTGNASTTYSYAIPMNSTTTSAYGYKVAQYGSTSTGFVSFTPQGATTATITLNADSGITQATASTVAGYTTLSTLDRLYDYSAYWETLAAGIGYNRFTSKSSATVSLGSVGLTVTNAAPLWTVTGTAPAATALAIYAGTALAAGTTFTQLNTNGTVTIGTGSSITCLYTVNGSTSYLLQLTGISPASSTLGQAYIYISNGANGGGTQQVSQQVSGTSYSYGLPPGTSGTYSYKIAQYGNTSTGFVNFTPGVGGLNSVAMNLSSDIGITQANPTTVSGYSTLTTLDQIYDYAAYWEASSSGITVARLVSKNGTQISLGGTSFTYSNATGTLWTYTGGASPALTIKNGTATTLANGSVWASLLTTSTATFTSTTNQAVIYSSSGNSGILTISVPANLISAGGASIYLQNGSSVQQASVASQTTTPYTFYTPLNSNGSDVWTWVVKRPGYTFALGTFTPATGGQFIVAPSTPKKLNADGSAMYTATTSTLASVSFSGTTEADILIGNGSVNVQTILDLTETALATTSGMTWLASGKGECSQFLSANGNFIFLSAGWRFKATTSGNASTVNGFAVSSDNVTTNTANGLVTFLTSTQATDVAAAVWNALATNYTIAGSMGAVLSDADLQAKLAAALSA